jgi:hypothetical protein
MSSLSPEEQEKILHAKPKGTFALLLVFAVLFMGGFLYMYFYMFLLHGPVN